jgi:Ca-activated chloride channel family protein
MSRQKELTYNINKWVLLAVLVELVFWFLAFQFFYFFGYFVKNDVGERITFLAPENAWYLLFIVIVVAIKLVKMRKRNKLIQRGENYQALTSMINSVSTLKNFRNFFLVRSSIVFIVLALMQPAFGEKATPMKVSGIEMVFALDISNSMNVRDMSNNTSRLESAQRAMKQFVKIAPASKLGLVVFAGGTYPQLPLTADKGLMKLHIDELSTDLISTQGTNISAALVLAADYFSKENYRKIVILITDGEDHEGGVDEMIETYAKRGIELYVLGLGTSEGGLVPKDPKFDSKGYLKDELGRSVISYLNKDMIYSIAQKANTTPYITNDAYPNINSLLTQINKRKATEDVDLEFKVKENRYYVPLWIAFVLLVVKLGVDIKEVRGEC